MRECDNNVGGEDWPTKTGDREGERERAGG